MNNDNYFEAMRELWLAYGGEPDKELHPEAHGRWIAARMAEARRPDSRLSDFDEWARRELREQAKADDLHGVRGALERIATALEAGQGEEEQAPKVMQGVGLDPDATVDGVAFSDDTTTELLSPDGPTQTSFLRLSVDELGFGAEVRSIDSGPVTAYADASAEWEFNNPDELDALAEFFQTKMPQALRALAATWRQLIADGTIPAAEDVA